MCALFKRDIFCRNLLSVTNYENYQVTFFFPLYKDRVLVLVTGLEKFWMEATFLLVACVFALDVYWKGEIPALFSRNLLHLKDRDQLWT